jgi:hypothetical protein
MEHQKLWIRWRRIRANRDDDRAKFISIHQGRANCWMSCAKPIIDAEVGVAASGGLACYKGWLDMLHRATGDATRDGGLAIWSWRQSAAVVLRETVGIAVSGHPCCSNGTVGAWGSYQGTTTCYNPHSALSQEPNMLRLQ